MTLSDKEGIFTLIAGCHHFGVRDVVISPGSRNAPLTISFNRSNLFECHSIADERSAAFYALGIAQATQKPVAVICTSGSAVANFAPALTEAFYQKTPLIAITADRPLQWTDQGNGQTIRQQGIFKNFTVNEFSLFGEPTSKDQKWYNRRKISEVFADALYRKKGPIHINVPLSEPLYGMKTYNLEKEKPHFYKVQLPEPQIAKEEIENYSAQFSNTKKILILAGQMSPNAELQQLLREISGKENVVIFTETTANLNFPNAIDTIDRVIVPLALTKQIKDFMPDLLITFGGLIVSKKVKSLLREFQPARHWHISTHDSGLDTFQCLTDEIQTSPQVFFSHLLKSSTTTTTSNYNEKWQLLKNELKKGHEDYVSNLEYSDFYVFREILNQIKSPIHLHMANSSPVRYIQLFGHNKNIMYHGNRGTSGIDGSTSTAAGIAKATPENQHILITGDMAFQYDINGLWNRNFPQNLKIIVINNGGGGIFRIIDGPDRVEELEEFFEAHHPVDFEMTAKSFGLAYFQATDEASLKESLKLFFEIKKAGVLEVKTPAHKNAKWLKNYFLQIGQQVHSLY